jgi:hypothetical protein
MRKTILATAIGILALTGCATSKDYQIYAQTQQQIATARAEAEIARYETLRSIANSGDTTARVAAVIALQQGASSNNNSPRIEQPTSVGDTVLKWTSVLLPSLTQFYSIGKSTDLAIVNSNNSLEGQKSNNGIIVDLVQGRVTPIVGTENDVLIYPR